MNGEAPRRVNDVVNEFQELGYSLSRGRRDRLKSFGIEAFRDEHWCYTAETIQRLRFLLEVERRFKFDRHHNDLAFELALMDYPVIPWERFQDGVYNRVERTLTALNVALHRLNNLPGTEFLDREILQVSVALARKIMTKPKDQRSPSEQIVFDLITQVAAVLLRVMYLDAKFAEADIRRLLFMTGLPEIAVDDLAKLAAKILNDSRSLFFVNDENALLSGLKTSDNDPQSWKTIVVRTHKVFPLADAYSGLFDLDLELFQHARFPDIGSLPTRPVDQLQWRHIMRVAIFAIVFAQRYNDEGNERLEEFARGEDSLAHNIVNNLKTIREFLPQMLRQKYDIEEQRPDN